MGKAPLVNQPTNEPSRKWWAALAAGVAVNAAYGALDTLWPDHPFGPYKADLLVWVTIGVMQAVHYFTRNRA